MGKVQLPTLKECLNITNDDLFLEALSQYINENFYDDIMNTPVLMVNSDPMSIDADEDGILDFDEFKAIRSEKLMNTTKLGSKRKVPVDTDGDGISDKNEKLYKTELDPNRKDTVESLFKNKTSGYTCINNNKEFSWITLNGNNITFNVRINYKEKKYKEDGTSDAIPDKLRVSDVYEIYDINDTNDKAKYKKKYGKVEPTENGTMLIDLDTTNLLTFEDFTSLNEDQINWIDNEERTNEFEFWKYYNKKRVHCKNLAKSNYDFLNSEKATLFDAFKIEKDTSIYDLMVNSINNKWVHNKNRGNVYEGNEYDFYPGMRISTSVVIHSYDPKDIDFKYVDICFIAGKCGHSTVSNDESVDNSCIKIMNVFQSLCNCKEENHNKFFQKDCTYYNQTYSIEKQLEVFPHEFGHLLGLGDAYRGAKIYGGNKTEGFELLEQAETSLDCIMNKNHTVYLNDVEMVWHHFTTKLGTKSIYVSNKGFKDYVECYVPDNGKTVSNAFRAPFLVYQNGKNEINIYDTSNGSIVKKKIDTTAYSNWKSSIGKSVNPNTGVLYSKEKWYKSLP